jgi:hypothetical protein
MVTVYPQQNGFRAAIANGLNFGKLVRYWRHWRRVFATCCRPADLHDLV